MYKILKSKASKSKDKIVGKYFQIISWVDGAIPIIKVLSETDEHVEVEFIRDYSYRIRHQNSRFELFSNYHRPVFFEELKARSFKRLKKCSKKYLKQCGIDFQHECGFYSSLYKLVKTMSS